MQINKQNVLLLSAGRRVELIKSFQIELKKRNLSSLIFSADLNPNKSAACQVSDQSFRLPHVTSLNYVEELFSLCQNKNIGLVVPTIDTELLILAKHRERFAEAGIHVVVSDETFVRVCLDKRLTVNLFESMNIGVPKILSREHLSFPCFVKPYDGSRSVGAMRLNQSSDVSEVMVNDPKLMFMELIGDDFYEYSVDAYYSRDGILKCLVPRHRLEVRDGEISKGVTRKNQLYKYLAERITNLEGARGCLNIQLFAHSRDGIYAALEINPRFGGGYPLAYAAGALYPGWLIDEYIFQKEISFFDDWTPDLMMLRYDAHVLVANVN